jgi:drug/metabolite transporter (DMT)-like permease
MSRVSRLPLSTGKAIVYTVISAACWGLTIAMNKLALNYIPPLHLLVIQLASSITFLWIAAYFFNSYSFLNWQTIRYSITGILEPGLAYMFSVLGLVMTTASNASLINATEPIIIILMSCIFLKEKLNKNLLLLILFTFIGIGLIVCQDLTLLKFNEYNFLGDILIFGGEICASIYNVVSHNIVKKNQNIDPLVLVAVQQTVGFICITLVWHTGILGHQSADLSTVSLEIWILAIASGIMQYALAFWFYLSALREVAASTAALCLTLIPVFGIGGAYVFLHEHLTFWQWLGAILIVTAVSSISWQQSQSA